MALIKLLTTFALVGSIAWCITEPGYEPGIAIITSLSALVGALFVNRKKAKRDGQKQVVSENGFGIQAGGDVTTGDIKIDQGDRNVQ